MAAQPFWAECESCGTEAAQIARDTEERTYTHVIAGAELRRSALVQEVTVAASST